jgi:hypothetical protein
MKTYRLIKKFIYVCFKPFTKFGPQMLGGKEWVLGLCNMCSNYVFYLINKHQYHVTMKNHIY